MDELKDGVVCGVGLEKVRVHNASDNKNTSISDHKNVSGPVAT